MPAANDLFAAALAVAFSSGLFAYAFVPVDAAALI